MPTQKQMLAIGATVVGVGVAAWGLSGLAGASSAVGARARRRRRRGAPATSPTTTLRGSVVCPAEVGHIAPPATIKPGDFVAVRVASHDGATVELIWALVEGNGKLPGRIRVRFVPAVGDDQVIAPKTEEHGFDIGQRLEIAKDCVWEVLRTNPHGMALCGTWGEQVAGRPPGGSWPGAAAGATVGDEVLVYTAPVAEGTSLKRGPGWNVENPAWSRVIEESPSRHVLRIELGADPPDPPPALKLRRGSRIDITRDCIFDVRAAGGGG